MRKINDGAHLKEIGKIHVEREPEDQEVAVVQSTRTTSGCFDACLLTITILSKEIETR